MRIVAECRLSLVPLACVALALACASCTDVRLAKYRDDRLLDSYHYALGEEYVDAGGLKLCYQEHGAGPAVLILPGLGTNIDFWQLNIPALAEDHHVLAVDLPGLGKSDKPDAGYDLLWMCDRIVAFLDVQQVPRVSIIGGSLGGHLGLLLALNHPERVEKLVMMGSTGAWPPPHLLLELGLKLLWNEALVTDYVRTHWDDVYRLMFLHETELTRALYRQQIALRANGSRYAPEGRALARALRSIFYHSCRRRLPDVHIPVLLTWGEKDEIHPPEDALYLRRRLPNARLVIVPGAAHEVMVDQPDTFNRIVRAFLKSGTAGVADSLTPR